MPLPSSQTYFRDYDVSGQLLSYADLSQDVEATRDLLAAVVEFIIGTFNALPPSGVSGQTIVPLTIVPGVGLAVTIGGVGQAVFLNGRVVTVCPVQNFTISPNTTGSTRIDLIQIQYAATDTNPRARAQENLDTTISAGTAFDVQESVVYGYKVGTTIAPSPDAGWQAFATIAVPNGASSITSGEITYLFPSTTSILQTLFGAFVTAVNAQSGAVTLTAGGGITITNPSAGVIQITNSGVTGLNTLTGPLTLATSGAGISLSIGGSTLTFANTGVTSLNGETGDISLVAGDGIGVTAPTGTTLQVANLGVLSLNSETGAVNIVAGSGISVTSSSGTITIGLTGTVVPIGGSSVAHLAFSGSLVAQSLQLSAPLQGGSGAVYSVKTTLLIPVDSSYSSGGTIKIAGDTTTATWDYGSPGQSQTVQVAGANIMFLFGTAVGGQQPKVNFTVTGTIPTAGQCVLILEAVRVV